MKKELQLLVVITIIVILSLFFAGKLQQGAIESKETSTSWSHDETTHWDKMSRNHR